MIALAKSLAPTDRIALVTFNYRVTQWLEPSPVDEQVFARLADENIPDMGHGLTNIWASVNASLDLAGAVGNNARVIFLTDGCPSCGETRTDAILDAVEKKTSSVVLSTLGYGKDVDPVLLALMASTGRGDFTYIAKENIPLAAMGSELSALISTVATEVELEIDTAEDVEVVDKYHRFTFGEDEGKRIVRARLPDLLDQESRSFPINVRWTRDRIDGDSLGRVRLRFRNGSSGKTEEHEADLRLSVDTQRGKCRPALVKTLLLQDISGHVMNELRHRSGYDAPRLLMAKESEVISRAEAAGIEAVPQVQQAINALARIRWYSENQQMSLHRHSIVACVTAMARGRCATGGLGYSDEEVTMASKSQIRGLSRILEHYESTETI